VLYTGSRKPSRLQLLAKTPDGTTWSFRRFAFQEPFSHDVFRSATRRQPSQLGTLDRSQDRSRQSQIFFERRPPRTHRPHRPAALEDAAAYEAHLKAFQKRCAPATDEERNLVQSLADTEWRLLRIPSLEMGIYAVGRLELASNFQEIEDPQARAALIEAKVYLTYQRQLNNLSIQEGRLIKQRDKALAELDRLQKLRARETYAALSRATDLYAQAKAENRTFQPAAFGFEFTTAQLEEQLEARKTGRGLQSAISAGLLGKIAA
jgi:hypothetical protein